MRFKFISMMVLTLMLIVGITSNVSAQEVIVPGEFANMSDFSFPSGFTCSVNPNGSRTQTLYPADELVPGTITAFATRAFPGSSGYFDVTIPNVTVKMSTTSATPFTLSNVFAENVGPDETTVFQGDLLLIGQPPCNTDPCPFAPPAIFQQPFTYNPNQGNLLVEFIIPPCVGGLPGTVTQDATDVITSVFVDDSSANSGELFSIGFISEFTYGGTRPIPTVSEWGLIAMAGLLGIAGFIYIRRNYNTV